MTAAKAISLFLLCSMLFASGGFAAEKEAAMKPDEAKAKQAYALGVQAYIWGYPMVVGQKSRDAARKRDRDLDYELLLQGTSVA